MAGVVRGHFCLVLLRWKALMWGLPLTFGVFQTYYETHEPFKNHKSLQLIGALTTGVAYLGTPLGTWLTLTFRNYRSYVICTGWLICVSASVASSFATKFWHLIVTQGLLYGFGFLIIYYPVLSMLNEWFTTRRGMAYGLLFASAGAFGLGLPFVVQILLDRYEHAITLRVCGITIFVVVGSTIPLLRPRLPPKVFEPHDRKFDTSVFFKAAFIAFTVSNVFQGLGFFLPSTYLPSFVSDIGLSTIQGAVALSLLNLLQIFGKIIMGYVLDRYDVYVPMLTSTIFSAVVVFLAWDFAKTLAPLIISAVFYGFFAGGYSVLYCRFATALSDESSTGLWLYSIFEFQRGASSIVGSLSSGFLVNSDIDLGSFGIGNYQRVVLLVGSAMLASCLGGIGWFFRGQQFQIFKIVEVSETDVEEEAGLV